MKAKDTYLLTTIKNTVISPNFLVYKFCGKEAIRPKLCGNCSFPQNLHTRKLGEITVFYVVCKFRTKPCR